MHFINMKALILILDWDEKVWNWIKSLSIVKVQKKYYLKKKVTETVKIINEKEIAVIKISEHILITLCQLRNIAGSRDVVQ